MGFDPFYINVFLVACLLIILIIVCALVIHGVITNIMGFTKILRKQVPNITLEYRKGDDGKVFTHPYRLDVRGESRSYTKHQVRQQIQKEVNHVYARSICEGALEEVFNDRNKKMIVREIKARALYIKVGEKERCIVLDEL